MVALLFKESPVALSGWKAAEKNWGPIDFVSEVRPFDYTDYYEKEMGRPLYRRWATFRTLVPQDRLPEIKWQALEIESQWMSDERRQLNFDPGLVTAERLILSTGKNYSHRLYLGKGIFGDLALVYVKKSFQPLPWTYPDYRDESSLWMFNKIRERYLKEISNFGSPTSA